MNSKKMVKILILCILIMILVVMASLSFGARKIGFTDVITALFGTETDTLVSRIVKERIPRTIFSIVAGSALAVSGAIMQTITRNPISDPSILGVNTGASLAVVAGIAWFQINTYTQYIFVAVIGAFAAAIFVYGIASLGYGGITPVKLALSGAATSAALSSMVSAVMLPRTEVMNAFRFWQVGSVSGAEWKGMLLLLPIVLIAFLIVVCMIPSLNMISLGDETAKGLGVNVNFVRGVAAFAGVILCGSVTALAGPIGFVGLMIPHIVRMLFGSDMKYMIPFSAVGGAILLTGSDVIGRMIGSPGELEVGVVTALIGAPVLIAIVRKSKGK